MENLNIVPLARDSHNRAALDFFGNPIIMESHNHHHRNPIIIIILGGPKIAKISQPMVYTSPGGVVAIISANYLL